MGRLEEFNIRKLGLMAEETFQFKTSEMHQSEGF